MPLTTTVAWVCEFCASREVTQHARDRVYATDSPRDYLPVGWGLLTRRMETGNLPTCPACLPGGRAQVGVKEAPRPRDSAHVHTVIQEGIQDALRTVAAQYPPPMSITDALLAVLSTRMKTWMQTGVLFAAGPARAECEASGKWWVYVPYQYTLLSGAHTASSHAWLPTYETVAGIPVRSTRTGTRCCTACNSPVMHVRRERAVYEVGSEVGGSAPMSWVASPEEPEPHGCPALHEVRARS